MINFLKRISYHPYVMQIIRFFHLRSIFRKLYFYLTKPPKGILKVQIGKINVKFYVSTPEQLRSLESGKEGEGRVAELLISYLKPGDVVFDIGAHLGFYTVLLAKAVRGKGKVVAFEPEKESYKYLEGNLKLNDLTNALIFQKALGNETGKGKLFLGQTVGNFSLVKTYERAIDYQEVKIVKGDQFVKEQSLPVPRLMKIDVEGYEYFVLLGLSETLSHPNCEIICCEVHPHLLPPGITGEKIVELMKSFGFKKFNAYTYKGANVYHLIACKK